MEVTIPPGSGWNILVLRQNLQSHSKQRDMLRECDMISQTCQGRSVSRILCNRGLGYSKIRKTLPMRSSRGGIIPAVLESKADSGLPVSIIGDRPRFYSRPIKYQHHALVSLTFRGEHAAPELMPLARQIAHSQKHSFHWMHEVFHRQIPAPSRNEIIHGKPYVSLLYLFPVLRIADVVSTAHHVRPAHWRGNSTNDIRPGARRCQPAPGSDQCIVGKSAGRCLPASGRIGSAPPKECRCADKYDSHIAPNAGQGLSSTLLARRLDPPITANARDWSSTHRDAPGNRACWHALPTNPDKTGSLHQ